MKLDAAHISDSDLIDDLSLEISLLRQAVECSERISDLIRRREASSLLCCLEERGRLIEDLALVQKRRKEAGMWSPGEWEGRLSPEVACTAGSLWETLSGLCRQLAQIDGQNLSSLCAWQEGIRSDLLSLWRGKATTSAYRGLKHKRPVPVFLDRQK